MFNLKFVNKHSYHNIRFKNLVQFYVDSRIETLFGKERILFEDYMKKNDLDYDDNFVAQCVLDKFWNDDIVELKFKIEDPCEMIRDMEYNYMSNNYTPDLFNKTIMIYNRFFAWNNMNMIEYICDEKRAQNSFETNMLQFVWKMNHPIIVYVYTNNDDVPWDLSKVCEYYDIQTKFKPIEKRVTSRYGSSYEVEKVVVCHQQQNKYVFNYKIGDIIDGVICKSGMVGKSKTSYDLNVTIKDKIYECKDVYCTLACMTDIKHFHYYKGLRENYLAAPYPGLVVIEYSDVPELSNYAKFFG